jgi:manganese transport protein
MKFDKIRVISGRKVMTNIKTPPKGLAILALIGPGLVWCSEMIGSGEVILTTRVGAILGTGVMWAIVIGIFLKYIIGLGGAHYTVCTGEGMIDMFDRIPGPRHWVVWIVLVVQLISATIAIGSIATAAGVFLHHLIPFSGQLAGWIVALFALFVAWSGGFNLLKIIMSFFVLIIILGVLYVAGKVMPDLAALLTGFLFKIPAVPAWAIEKAGINQNPWREILPLMGWAAGGFASQVWYSYWVIGAGYGTNQTGIFGQPADLKNLNQFSAVEAHKLKGWCRVINVDASTALIITTLVTLSFLIAGAGILRPNELAPEGANVVVILSTIFSSQWGALGGILFILTGVIALVGTLLAQLAGWPRLLADSFRICFPAFQQKFEWRTQYRIFLLFFFITNIVIVFTLGFRPVFLVKMGAVLDGLLLTPFQAIWVALGLFVVMPRLFSKEVYKIIKPHWLIGVLLLLSFLVFGYFCVFQIPYIL